MTVSYRIDQGTTWCLPNLDNLRFMRAQYVRHTFVPHSHDYYVLGIVESGVQSFTYRSDRLITTPGNLIVLNPGEVHTGEAAVESGFTYRALYPSAQLMTKLTDEFHVKFTNTPTLVGGTIANQHLFNWIRYLHRLSETPASMLQLEDGLTKFFLKLIQHYTNSNFSLKEYRTASRAVILVRDYIEANYAERITLSDLSALAHISPYHLSRLFRQQIGISPHKYLENVRIRHAEQLLKSGLPIADIAFATGFSSQSHLTRTFKRFMGTTPGELIRQRKIV